MKRLYISALIACISVLFTIRVSAQQSVAIGQAQIDTDAVLLLVGNGNQGLIIPKTANVNASSMAKKAGMVVYNEADGKVYSCDGSTWSALGGGVQGNPPVLQINGNNLSIFTGTNVGLATTAPTTIGQILVWDGTKWTSSTNNTNTTIQVGQVLSWSGLNWINTPLLDANGKVLAASLPAGVDTDATNDITTATTATGDLTGTFPNLGIGAGKITAAQLSSMGATNSGQVLQWNGTAWVPTTPATTTFGNLSSTTSGVSITGGTGAVAGSGATVNIQNATATQAGLLTATDFTTFNNKIGSVAVTTPINNTGTASAPIIGINPITNADISGTAAIADTKLATISTAGKVAGGAITSGTIGGSTSVNTTGNIATTGTGTLNVAGASTLSSTLNVGGVTTLSNLTGTGNRMVIANATGVLSTQAIPTITTNDLTTSTTGVAIANGTGAINGANPVTVNIQNATASQPGLLTAADFTTFNNKGTVTNVTGTAPISVATGTTTPTISIAPAGATTNGYLSSADWNTFNNKQGTITLTTTGTSGAATFSSGTLNIPQYAPATAGSSVLKGNGTGGFSNAVSGTDFAPATSGSALLKANGTGGFANAVSGTDFAPATSGSALLKANGTGGFANAVAGTDYIATETDATVKVINGIVKSNGSTISAAVSGTDYAPATSGSSILKGNGLGGFSNAVSGTDFAPATSGSALLKANGTGGFANAVAGTDYLTTNQTITLSGDVTGSGTTAITTTIGAGAVTATKLAAGSVSGGVGGVISDATITDADISATAAIADSKLATIATAGKVNGGAITTGTIGGNTIINTTGGITAATFTGDGSALTNVSATVADGSITGGTAGAGVKIAANTITMANINPSAGILFNGSIPNSVGDLVGDFASGMTIQNQGTTGTNIITAINNGTATGTVPVARGGTGISATPANGQLLIGNGTGYAASTLTAGTNVSITNGAGSITINSTGLSNPMTTPGDIIYGGAAGAATRLAGGATGILKSNGTTPTWGAVNLASTDVSGTLPVANGGTGVSTATNGQVLIGNGSGFTAATLTAGTNTSITNGAGTITINSTGLGSTLNSGNIFVGSGTNVATGVAMSGDATISNTGALTIAAGAVTSTKLANSSVSGGTAGIISDGTITDADINGAAAIAGTKIVSAFGNQSITTTGAGAAFIAAGINAGPANEFSVNATGNITKINNLQANFPSVQGVANSVLTNDGVGNLSWATSSGWGLTGNTGTNPATNFVGTTDNKPLIFSTNSSGGGGERIRVNGTGEVGIGTTTPIGGSVLDIDVGGSGGSMYIRKGANAAVRMTSDGTATFIESGSDVNPASTAPLHFTDMNANNYWMTIAAGGKVGIGTTTPGAALELVNNKASVGILSNTVFANTGQVRAIQAWGSGSSAQNFGVYASADVAGANGAIGVWGEAIGSGGTHDAIGVYAQTNNFTNTTAKAYGLYATSWANAPVNWAGYFDAGNVHIKNGLSVGAVDGTFGSAGQVLTSNGAGVAPSWTAPSFSAPLLVPATTDAFQYNSNSSIRMTINNTLGRYELGELNTANPVFFSEWGTGNTYVKGNLGIGTLSPSNQLTVLPAVTTGYTNAAIRYGDQTASGYIGGGTTNSFSLWDDAGSQQIVVQQGTGNVGIGTPAPATQLQIDAGQPTIRMRSTTPNTLSQSFVEFGHDDGSGGFTKVGHIGDNGSSDNLEIFSPNFISFNSNLADRFVIGTAGQLGAGSPIDYGTTGQVLTSGGPSGTAHWANASGGAFAAVGNGNVTYGGQTPGGVSTNNLLYLGGNSSMTGIRNVVLGESAGPNLTVGSNSVILGYGAGYNLSSGLYNVIIGDNAGASLLDGGSNVAIGHGADITPSSTNSIAIGTGALINFGTVDNGIAIGKGASAIVNNTMVLGGTGSNAVKVGIGLNTPATALDVLGDVQISGGSNYKYASSQIRYKTITFPAFNYAGNNVAVVGNYTSFGLKTSGGALGTSANFYAPVDLPDGAIVTGVSAWVGDSDATYNCTVSMLRAPVSVACCGSVTTMASAASSGSGGQSSISTSSITNPTIDNQNNGYFLAWLSIENNPNLVLYNVQITYTVSKVD